MEPLQSGSDSAIKREIYSQFYFKLNNVIFSNTFKNQLAVLALQALWGFLEYFDLWSLQAWRKSCWKMLAYPFDRFKIWCVAVLPYKPTRRSFAEVSLHQTKPFFKIYRLILQLTWPGITEILWNRLTDTWPQLRIVWTHRPLLHWLKQDLRGQRSNNWCKMCSCLMHYKYLYCRYIKKLFN